LFHIAALAALTVFTAQPAEVNAQSGPAWAHKCEQAKESGKQLCRISQNLVIKKDGKQQRLLTIAIRPKADSSGYAMLFALPHGLHLPSGVEFAVDENKPKKLVIQTSDARGAYTGTNLDAKLLNSMKRGNKLTVKLVTNARKKIGLAVDLTGFSAAYTKLTSTN
jgi:invasion protein IalB